MVLFATALTQADASIVFPRLASGVLLTNVFTEDVAVARFFQSLSLSVHRFDKVSRSCGGVANA